ncbi:FAD-linked oxidase [Pedobacter sp. HMF7647]|uniref:FAD-linked oxidase n=1 Tax=Hufsiella arboris TaxID=2695275 RepID=A0A7K1YAY0_9SPHI|nr:FAD-linked oxidase [Hufsiella arboris]MXV51501.1 FAD-linked oxidase [Hufsiella arboris]
MASTIKQAIGSWNTLHENGPFPAKFLHITSLETKANMPSVIDRYNDATIEIRRLLKEAMTKGEGFRAIGSRWSMSHIAHHQDNMQVNANMNIKKAMQADELHPQSAFKPENLFFFQCGNVIKEIHNFLAENGKSLKASGASNGQTIAGCVSTGVHGSALDVGSVQDYVVGLNLIIGPEPDDVVYIERHSKPALTDQFAANIKSRIIRNDDLFNAALVSLGSFGFIHGVVVEAEDRFLLKRYVKRISSVQALELAASLNFGDSPFKIPTETDANGKGIRPYHYKVFINPYVDQSEYVVEMIYKKPYQPGYPDPIPAVKTSIYRDLILLFIKIAEKWDGTIPTLIKLLQKSILPPVDLELTGTLYEIFWDAGYQGPAFACSVGVDHKDSPKALDLLVKLAKEEGPIPGIYAMRFVKQSPATIAFTKFPVTCMIEIDGLLWDAGKNNMISLKQFCTRMIEVLKANNIPFTLHWGKNADWSFPGLAGHMYGGAAEQWKKLRSAILSPEAAKLFSNDFLKDLHLDEYLENEPTVISQPVIV